jgi:cytochrome c oxidase subunit 4
MSAEEHAHDEMPATGILLLTFFALALLTLATWAAAYVDLGRWNLALAIGIACLKATLVLRYFMNLAYGTRLMFAVVATALLFVAIVMGPTLADFVMRSLQRSPV